MDNVCRRCSLQRDCQSVYQALGNTQGPSVVWKSFFIFLAPLIVFAAAAAFLDNWLKIRITHASVCTALVFLISATAGMLTSVAVWLAMPAWTHRSCSRKEANVFCKKTDI